jgi:hypothetical protein
MRAEADRVVAIGFSSSLGSAFGAKPHVGRQEDRPDRSKMTRHDIHYRHDHYRHDGCRQRIAALHNG